MRKILKQSLALLFVVALLVSSNISFASAQTIEITPRSMSVTIPGSGSQRVAIPYLEKGNILGVRITSTTQPKADILVKIFEWNTGEFEDSKIVSGTGIVSFQCVHTSYYQVCVENYSANTVTIEYELLFT